jgi:hypothetical protein
MKLRIASLALFVLFTFSQAKVDAGPPSSHRAASRNSASSAQLPETNLLINELQQSDTTLTSLSARTERAEKTTGHAAAIVNATSLVIRGIDQIDDLLIRVTRQLDPVSKLPPTRELRPLVANLTQLQKQVHKVRVKGDKVQEQHLKPLHEHLENLEDQLKVSAAELKTGAGAADQARRHLVTLRDVVQSSNVPAADAALDTLSKRTRAGIRPVNAGLKSADDASRAVEDELNGLIRDLSGVTSSESAVRKLQRDLAPVDKAARELDKVLNKRIAIKLFGKEYGFTVRQVIEGPGKVADFILKPLQVLADAALKPVLHAFKLEIKPPRELAAIEHSLDAAAARQAVVTQSIARVESALNNIGLAAFRESLRELSVVSPSQLASKG